MNLFQDLKNIGFTIIVIFLAIFNEIAIRFIFESNGVIMLFSILYLSLMLPIIVVFAKNFDLMKNDHTLSFRELFKKSFPLIKPFLILFISVKILELSVGSIGLNNLSSLVTSLIGLNYASTIVVILLVLRNSLNGDELEEYEPIIEIFSKD